MLSKHCVDWLHRGLDDISALYRSFKRNNKKKEWRKKNVKSFSSLICHDFECKNHYSAQALENKERLEKNSYMSDFALSVCF